MLAAMPPLSLYLHFPWCVAKCPYCDFNSHSLRGELPAAAYVDALLSEVQAVAPAVAGRRIETVFMGGGTPSLFPAAELARLLAGVREHLQLADAAEITLEANPGALEHEAFGDYLAAGINRLSLGVQSFSADSLTALGRIHSVGEVLDAYAAARHAGFTNINLDLMYGLPDQTLAAALDDVSHAIGLGPEHISWYHLTLEPNTVFHRFPPRLPDDDTAWQMQAEGAALLRAAGYENYEVSAWARAGREARHNLNYWRFGDYLGLGAGAHGKLTLGPGRLRREQRIAHPREYLQRAVAGQAMLPPQTITDVATIVFEFMLNNLRLRAGFLRADFERCTGLPFAVAEAGISRAVAGGLLQQHHDGGGYAATERGWAFLDNLQGLFLPGS